MVLAAFQFSIMTLFVKLVGQRLPSQEIVLARSIVTLGYSYVLVRWAREALWGYNKWLLITRGAAGFAALSCIYYAVTVLPLADATVIQYTNPVFTALLAAFFLKETMTGREVFALALSLAGVVLIARPSFLVGASGASLDLFAVGIALLGALFSAAAYVSVRKLRETEHPMVIVFYFPLVSTIGSAPFALPQWVWPTPLEWLMLIIGVSVTAQLGQIWLTKGLYLERAGRAMTMSYLQIVFAAVWGMLFFSEYPDAFSFTGAALVLGGTVLASGK